MRIEKATKPAHWPVSLDLAKMQARIDGVDEDLLTQFHLEAATEYVATYTARILARQEYVVYMEADVQGWYVYPFWKVCVPLVPVAEVISVEYRDADGDWQTIAVGDYSWKRVHDQMELWFNPDFVAPTTYDYVGADVLRITVNAGYDDPLVSGSGDDPELELPQRLRLAILMLTAHWHESREAVLPMNSPINFAAVEMAAKALMDQLRIFR